MSACGKRAEVTTRRCRSYGIAEFVAVQHNIDFGEASVFGKLYSKVVFISKRNIARGISACRCKRRRVFTEQHVATIFKL